MKLAELKIFEAEQAPAGPIELKDLIEYFPGNYAKAIQKMWGKDRLVYKGMKFFDKGGLGEVYDKALEAIDEWYRDEDNKVNVYLPIPDGDNLGMTEFEYEASVESLQEVYVGYRPEGDRLYIGVDAWLDENDFNDEWDRKFKSETGKEYNEEYEDHSALFHDAWKKYTNMRGYGILFHVTFSSGGAAEVEVELESQGGFYGGVRKMSPFKSLGLVDVRLN